MTCTGARFRNPPTLTEVVKRVIGELTSRVEYGTRRHVFAPHLVKLGDELQEALDRVGGSANAVPLRPDVFAFAVKMSNMMAIKDAEKGPIDDYELGKALFNMSRLLQRFGEYPLPNRDEMLRIFVHIANFAMIAENTLNPKGTEDAK